MRSSRFARQSGKEAGYSSWFSSEAELFRRREGISIPSRTTKIAKVLENGVSLKTP